MVNYNEEPLWVGEKTSGKKYSRLNRKHNLKELLKYSQLASTMPVVEFHRNNMVRISKRD